MKIASILCMLALATSLYSQEIPKKNYVTKNLNEINLSIDGKFDEPAWQTANWEDHFIQHEPVEGAPPHQQTEFAVLYDENNVYVAIKCLDTSPDSISMRMTRRDVTDGDLVGIMFDTYNDKRTAFAFIVSAAGVKTDMVEVNDGETEDNTWDPIWFVKTSLQDYGWNAEMRIPLTQLRFDEGVDQIWGLQVLRFIFRKEELSSWQAMERDKSGFVSQFGTMNGIKDIKPKNNLDIMPYVVARTDRYEKDKSNPFLESGKKNNVDVGFDAKIGLTNYLTMDLTVNPDFGQVEADPSEVNLSTYETFFEEKRPFFIEGKNILTYKLNFGDGDLAYDGLFYSRRIGKKPAYYPELTDGEYADVPDATRILGAAKITGKTKTGWSIGVLESVTAKEKAEIKGIGEGRTQTVEPLTNYFVGRLQKDFNEGNTYLGGMVTAVNRSINDQRLEYLHKEAYSGGLDFVHKWDNKKWELDISSYFSHVASTKEAITLTQKNYNRGFQRPDNDYKDLDTNRTSLSGQGGKVLLGEFDGNQKFMFAVSWKSPGLELNDVGYLQSPDDIMEVFWTGYRFYKPFLIFREANLNLNQWVSWDWGGNMKYAGGNINGYTQFKNYWSMFGSFNISSTQRSNSLLRGGPALKTPGYINFNLGFNSNQQKKLTLNLSTGYNSSFEKDFSKNSRLYVGIGYRPIKTLSINLSPGFNDSKTNLQYVTQSTYGNETRYIFAHIDRKTLSMSVRINYNITPDLSIQYWGQPFVATGKYSDFKHITDSKAGNLEDRYHLYGSDQISFNSDTYYIDENRDNSNDYSFGKPDFNVKEFLSNLVLRWEYKPGSTLFLVWTQNRSGYVNDGSFNFSDDFSGIFDEKPYNIFLVKLSYRLGR
ncbi:MAG: carbohydrate binding family 9 domain-containing protein [Prolixibacteraceae bacterium]|nr:carbohydrate binding family 9 domain-containing protein [Prolixibacteraceae bacterium]MBN2775168.1 carbohydrate binding family 9 domain-containing protein [Prolixibacteraceae bacterium]